MAILPYVYVAPGLTSRWGVARLLLQQLRKKIDFSHRDPWDEWYIDLHGWLIFMVNVGKYTSPMMDPMGIKKHHAIRTNCNTFFQTSTGTNLEQVYKTHPHLINTQGFMVEFLSSKDFFNSQASVNKNLIQPNYSPFIISILTSSPDHETLGILAHLLGMVT